MGLFEVLGILMVIVGIFLHYGAKFIVKRFDLAKKQEVEISDEMTNDEVEQYKFNKAVMRVKVVSLCVLLPGILLSVFEI